LQSQGIGEQQGMALILQYINDMNDLPRGIG
jgi:hypothetical protein